MKEEYIYESGKIIAYDDKEGLCDSVDYQDNINDIFITEDIIEYIESNLSLLINEKNNLEEKLKKDKKDIFFPVISMFLISLILPTFTVYLISILSGISFSSITIIGIHMAKLFTIFFGGLFTLIGSVVTLSNLMDYKINLKKLNGLNEELKFRKQTLLKEKNSLEQLKQDKKREKEEEIKKNPKNIVEYKNLLSTFSSLSNLYYTLGYLENKLIKYYNKGNLKEKMLDDFDDDVSKRIEEYVVEKAKVLKKEYNG